MAFLSSTWPYDVYSFLSFYLGMTVTFSFFLSVHSPLLIYLKKKRHFVQVFDEQY